MFFKTEQTITKIEAIKKTVQDEQNRPLVQINVQYPVVTGRDKDPYKKASEPFYLRLYENFMSFAENGLAQKAKSLIDTQENFKPLGAVMKYNLTFDGKRLVSLYADISVFDGEITAQTTRSAQLWGKTDGYLYTFDDLFIAGAKDIFIEMFAKQGGPDDISLQDFIKRLKRYFSNNNFYITDSGVFFFYPAERLGFRPGTRSFYISYADIEEKKLFKIPVSFF